MGSNKANDLKFRESSTPFYNYPLHDTVMQEHQFHSSDRQSEDPSSILHNYNMTLPKEFYLPLTTSSLASRRIPTPLYSPANSRSSSPFTPTSLSSYSAYPRSVFPSNSKDPQFPSREAYLSPTSFIETSAAQSSKYREFEEPPLLEELGIDAEQILMKSLSVLNPFLDSASIEVNTFVHDTDLAGPIAFCVILGASILLSGGKAHFGYVYGLAVTGCLVMYILLNLMTKTHAIKLTTVASVLGYCLLPIVVLSILSIFLSLRNFSGLLLSVLAVALCSMSASRFFVSVLGDANQRYLIAYPCALLYAVFDLIAIF